MGAPKPSKPQFYDSAMQTLESSPIWKLGVVSLGILLFSYTNYFLEFVYKVTGVPVKVALISGLLALFMLFLTGRPTRFFYVPGSILWFGYLMWMVFCAAMGTYPNGGLKQVFEYAIRFYILPVACCGLLLTQGSIKSAVGYCIAGCAFILFACFKWGEITSDVRFVIPNTSLSNPNDLATHLLMGVTFFLVPILYGSTLLRAISFGLIIPTIYYILKTGSRGNLVAIVGLAFVVFLVGSRRFKVAMITALPVAIGLAVLLIPSTTLKRLTLIVASSESVETDSEVVEDAGLRSSVASQMARMELVKQGLKLTLKHPIFGVGPFYFSDGMDLMIREETGRKSSWEGSHNTYIQASGETGIPGFVMYISLLFIYLRLAFRTYKQSLKLGERQNAMLSLGLFLSLLSYVLSTTFSHLLFSAFMPMIVGLIAANYLVCVELTARRKAMDLAAQPEVAVDVKPRFVGQNPAPRFG